MADKIVTRSDITAMTDTSGFGVGAENKCLTRLVVSSGIKRGVEVNFVNKTNYKTNQLVKKADISPIETIYIAYAGNGAIGSVYQSTSDSSSLMGTILIENDLEFSFFGDNLMETELAWPCEDCKLTSIIFRCDNGTYTTLFSDYMNTEVTVSNGAYGFTFEATGYGPIFDVSGGTLVEGESIYISGMTFEPGNKLPDYGDPDIYWNYQFIAEE